MSITIVMVEGKTLHLDDATPDHMGQLLDSISAGRGAFQFTIENRLYLINCANVLYAEVTPATATVASTKGRSG